MYNLIEISSNKIIKSNLELKEIDRLTSSSSFSTNNLYIQEVDNDKVLTPILRDRKWSLYLSSDSQKTTDNTLSELIRELLIEIKDPNEVIDLIEDELLKMLVIKYFNTLEKYDEDQLMISEELSNILNNIYHSLYRYEGLRSLYIGLKKYKVKEEKINTK